MKLLQYLYCRFYQLMVSVGNGDIARFASILFMTFVFGLNILTIFEIFDIVGMGVNEISKVNVITVMLFLFLSLYFLLIHNGKSSKILNQYEDETKKDRINGRVTIVVYIVLSIALLISTFFLMLMKNRVKI